MEIYDNHQRRDGDEFDKRYSLVLEVFFGCNMAAAATDAGSDRDDEDDKSAYCCWANEEFTSSKNMDRIDGGRKWANVKSKRYA